MENQVEILNKYIKTNFGKKEDFATFIGLTRQQLTNIIRDTLQKEHKQLPSLFHARLRKKGIDLFKSVDPNSNKKSTDIFEDNLVYQIPIHAEAGFIGGALSKIDTEDLNSYFDQEMPNGGFEFTIKGDSLNNTVLEGEKIITSKKSVRDSKEIQNGSMYALILKSNVICKRVSVEGNNIVLYSDNPIYKPTILDTENLIYMFKAKRIKKFDLTAR